MLYTSIFLDNGVLPQESKILAANTIEEELGMLKGLLTGHILEAGAGVVRAGCDLLITLFGTLGGNSCNSIYIMRTISICLTI